MSPRQRAGLWSVGWLVSLSQGVALAQTTLPGPPPSGDIYTCTDANGRKLNSDRPIAACRDREQTILNPSGTVKARLGPTPTAKELREIEAKAKAEQAEQARQEEEKRRDRALLTRYPTPEAHEKERADALMRVSQGRQMAVERIRTLQAQKAKLADEMAFYQKDPSRAPQKLRTQLTDVEQALAVQGRFQADKDAEVARVNARFDAEQQRLAPLWQLGAAPASTARPD